MKVSVIIPVYNGSKKIGKCLDSILSSSYKSEEIIVVDDGSNDNTAQIVRNYPVKLLMQQNRGPAVARNNGAKHATGDLLFFFDYDVVLKKNTIQLAIDTLKKKRAGAVFGVYAIDPANKEGFFPHYKALIDFYLFTRGDLDNYEIFESRCALVKKNIFKEFGGFNENLKWGMDVENEELGHRISKKYKMVVNKDIQVYHHFPGFKKIVKVYFIRPFWWMQLFIQRKKFYNSGPGTLSSGIGTAAAFFSFISLSGSTIFFPLIYLFAALSVLFLLSYSGFYSLVYKNRGLSMLLKCIPISYFFALVIAAGAFSSIFSYAFKKMVGIEQEKIF